MNENHPVTPPPELVQQWIGEFFGCTVRGSDSERYIATQAARWGADMELEASSAWVEREIGHGREWGAELRRHRRPKPPSLAEQALAQTNAILTDPNRALLIEVRETLELNRRALERLQELENNG